jgi:hypothetical protein
VHNIQNGSERVANGLRLIFPGLLIIGVLNLVPQLATLRDESAQAAQVQADQLSEIAEIIRTDTGKERGEATMR